MNFLRTLLVLSVCIIFYSHPSPAAAQIVAVQDAMSGSGPGDSRYVNITGDTMSGALSGVTSLTASSVTVTGNAFSVGGSTLVVANGWLGLGASPTLGFSITNGALILPEDGLITMGVPLSNAGNQINITHTNGNSYMVMGQGATGRVGLGWIYNATIGNGYGYMSTANAQPLALQANGTGFVGIGTTAPAQKLSFGASGTIGVDTADGADNGYMIVGSGGGTQDVSRGALMQFNGNEKSTNPGDAYIYAGNVAGGDIHFLTGAAASDALSILNGGNVGIGTTAPAYKLDVTGGIRATSTMTASAYYGDGAALTGVTIAVSSSAADGQSAASTDYIYVATATVTLRGGRTLWVFYSADFEQALAAARTYTMSLVVNGVEIDSHATTSSGSGAWTLINDLDSVTSTAGVNTIAIRLKSSNATGAQLFYNAQVDAVEF